MNQERQYLTVIAIDKGIIALIEPDGTIGYYRQRGISQLSDGVIQRAIAEKRLSARWKVFKQLPKHYSISYEDPDLMGRAYATFSLRK